MLVESSGSGASACSCWHAFEAQFRASAHMTLWRAQPAHQRMLCSLGLMAVLLASIIGESSLAACLPDTSSVPLSLANAEAGTFLGNAVGQTFRAVDTVITRITVWRPANDIDAIGTHLFVTTVDTAQTPPRPITQGILQDGPSVFIRDDSAHPGEPIRMDFVLDPPLALPRPGIYAFFLRRDNCDLGETRIVASTSNPYPYGFYWGTGTVATLSCYLRSVTGGSEHIDLNFEMEFCRETTTPTHRTTWGQLKIRYH
jgi:hypothetical protein